MMTNHTKRCLAAAVDELKRDGYMVLLVMMDRKSDTSKPLGDAMEVMFSETNDPMVVQAMAVSALKALSHENDSNTVH